MGIEVTDSKFAVYRAAIALAAIDNKITEEEASFLENKFSIIPFTEEQRSVLDDDLKNGVLLNDVVEKITDKRDRAHLINMSRILFHCDGQFCQTEQQILEEIHSRHMLTLDLEEALSQAEEVAHTVAEEYEMENKLNNSQGNFLQQLFNYIDEIF